MKEIFAKVESSFRASLKGEETIQHLIWWWGVLGYLTSYFILNRIVKITEIRFFEIVISLFAVFYFAWHIYALKKCSPKKPKLSKEEKEKLRAERRRELGKRLLRKLFLQEPITKWDPVFICMLIDAMAVAHFCDIILR